MKVSAILNNPVLIAAIIAWALAQLIKLPIDFLRHKRWNWAILLRAGGMPSSHSALVTAAAHGIALTMGYDSTVFALSVVLAIIVIYDATGIRRQAGRHATMINAMIRQLREGHPLKVEQLREVLGHSPLEAFVGLLLGLLVAQLTLMLSTAG